MRLPLSISATCDVFHISMLRKVVIDPLVRDEPQELEIAKDFTYLVKPRATIGCDTEITLCTIIDMV